MRTTPCWLLAGVLVACGSEAAPSSTPRVPSVPTGQTAPVQPAEGNTAAPASSPAAAPTAAPTAASTPAAELPNAAGSAAGTLRNAQRIMRDAVAADPAQQAKAPAALRALGPAALPALTDSLRAVDVTERRIAALTLLQWSDDLHRGGGDGAVVAALAAARDDADPSVRAAAEHAYRRAIGDSSALDAARAADEAAQRRDH